MSTLCLDKSQTDCVLSLIQRYRLPKKGKRYLLKRKKSRYKVLYVNDLGAAEFYPVTVGGRHLQENW